MFGKYDTTNNSWTQKASLPGSGRTGCIGVSHSGFGYVGLGWDGSNMFNDIFEFNPMNNSWLLETTYPGQGLRNCFAAVVNNELFVGGGSKLNGAVVSDFWKYNFSTGLWTQLSNFVLSGRQAGISFSIDSLIFFGMGHNNVSDFNDIWAYNVNSGLWSQYSNFPGNDRLQSSVNIVGKKAIIGGGNALGSGGVRYSDYYEFDYITNSWRAISGFISGSRTTSAGFTVGNRTFLSSGIDSTGTVLNDLWEIRGLLTDLNETNQIGSNSIYPNPTSKNIRVALNGRLAKGGNNLEIFDINGEKVLEMNINSNEVTISLGDLPSGIYLLRVNNAENKSIIQLGKLVKH